MKSLLPHTESLGGTFLLIALCVFFVGLVIWVYRRRSTEIYDRLAALPLEEDKREA